MSNPQAENGHTDIANEIMDALARIRIPGEAMQVLLAILRKTYGWHKKDDAISLSQFVSATGMSKSSVCKAISKLKSMKLIITQKGNEKYTTYRFNKNFDTWKSLPKKEKNTGRILNGRISIREIKKEVRERDKNICMCCGYNGNIANDNLHIHHIDFNQGNNEYNNLITLCKSCHGKAHNNNIEYKEYLKTLITNKGNKNELPNKEIFITQNNNSELPKSRHTKESITKETITKEKIQYMVEPSFDRFWEIYPKKVGKAPCLKKWCHVVKDDDQGNNIVIALQNQIRLKYISDDKKYCPNPLTWLNQERWTDEIKEEMKCDTCGTISLLYLDDDTACDCGGTYKSFVRTKPGGQRRI